MSDEKNINTILDSTPIETWDEISHRAHWFLFQQELMKNDWFGKMIELPNDKLSLFERYKDELGFWYYYLIKATIAEKYEVSALLRDVIKGMELELIFIINYLYSEEEFTAKDKRQIKFVEKSFKTLLQDCLNKSK
ncbi:MAG TPA: hypothetical protein VNX68_12855 [Nitrosopumilaceae archaeon]|nr:hypothetical protein [Nitrosopumilaceae archaeon]